MLTRTCWKVLARRCRQTRALSSRLRFDTTTCANLPHVISPHARHRGASLRYLSTAAPENSSSVQEKPIRILYGTQGGTAQIFSMQLSDAIYELDEEREVTTLGLHEESPSSILDPHAINVILTSVAGVGEPPDNARKFYEWIMSNDSACGDWSNVEYTVFGLGNQKAHPHHFNVIGKNIDARLQELGATRVFGLGLGDDGECIEDDFDIWLGDLMSTLQGAEEEKDVSIDASEAAVAEEAPPEQDPIVSSKHPALHLLPSSLNIAREDLLDLDHSFYASDVQRLTVTDNHLLNAHAAEYGLREMSLTVEAPYEAGDHLVVYPKNSYCMVEAYLEWLHVADPHAIIPPTTDSSYPHPTDISIMETLLHCVDLGAVPSPNFARELLGRKDINYKQDVALPRRTVLDLALESGSRVALETVLWNMTPMQPRYYSIASSSLLHPHDVHLTYRPVKYISSKGALREGTCTSYLTNLTRDSTVIGAVRSNPAFRLPTDPQAPILMLAGGCGIAPIRAFLEERLVSATENFGDAHLFLGFRSPSDEVYRELVDRALETGVLSSAHVSYTSGATINCSLVSDTVRDNGALVWDLMENGGYTYLCGGARTFGAAIEREVIDIIQQHGNMKEEDAMQYLRDLIKEGRFCEDLAD